MNLIIDVDCYLDRIALLAVLLDTTIKAAPLTPGAFLEIRSDDSQTLDDSLRLSVVKLLV